jgi:hypothetical protein
MPAVGWPSSFSETAALGFEFSHNEYRPRWQLRQAPQAIGKGTTTLSPTDSLCAAPGPTSTTSPMNSWPRMSPFSMVGTKPP